MITLSKRDAKDPDDTDDFTLDWVDVLESDETISSVTVSVITGDVSVSASSVLGTKTIARLTGGTAETTATVRFRVTTSANRQLDETLVIAVAER